MPPRPGLACALWLTLTLGTTAPAQEPAQEPARPGAAQPVPGRPTLFVEAGIGLYPDEGDGVRPGWVPVWVALENRGPSSSLELEVVVLSGWDEERQRRRVDLPAGQARREWFLVPVQQDGTWEVLAREESAEEPQWRSGARQLPVQPRQWQRGYQEPHRILEVIDPQARARAEQADWLPVGALLTRPRRVTPAMLPDHPLAWQDVDAVALRETDLGALSQAQLSALRAWLLAGGQLLLAPAERASWLTDRALLQVTGPLPVEEVVARPDCLARLYERPPARIESIPADPFPRREVRLLRALGPLREEWHRNAERRNAPPWPPVQRLPDGRALPLVQAHPRGLGTVHLLAFDPGASSFRAWPWREEFMSDLCSWLQSFSRRAAGVAVRDRPELARLVDSRRRPDVWPVLLLLGVYVACIGPLNGWLLRRRDAQPLLVLTVPAVALLFCLLVFALGTVFRGAALTFWRVRVLAGPLATPVLREETLASVMTGDDGQAALRVPRELVITRLPPLRGGRWDEPFTRGGAEGAPATCALALRPWEPRCFSASALREAGQGVSLAAEGEGLRLVNGTPWPLENPTWADGERLFRGPERVEPGQTALLAAVPCTPQERPRALLSWVLGGLDDSPRVSLARRVLEDRNTALGLSRGFLCAVELAGPALEVDGHAPTQDLAFLELWGDP